MTAKERVACAFEFRSYDRVPIYQAGFSATVGSQLLGREAYVGPFSWTPDWEYRATSANALFEGRLTGAAGRRFIVSTHARWLFADCRPLALPALARTVAPLLARPPQRFGCATLYELKDRPDMARAAPPSA